MIDASPDGFVVGSAVDVLDLVRNVVDLEVVRWEMGNGGYVDGVVVAVPDPVDDVATETCTTRDPKILK